MTYTVTSDNFAQPRGTTVTEAELEGCNIAALVAGGHLTPTGDQPDNVPAVPGEGA